MFDPRIIGKEVFESLHGLRQKTVDKQKLPKQKSMAQEIYTYLSTWGLMRLKAEETILKDGREEPVKEFFKCLEKLSDTKPLSNHQGLETLKNLSAQDYIGLTGLALEIAREFSFWVSAIYHDTEDE